PLAYLEWLAHAAASAPAAAVQVRLGSPLAVAAAYGGLGAAVLLARARHRRARSARRVALAAGAALLVALLVAGAGAHGDPRPPPGQLRVSFLDIGQGDATLVQHDGAAVLVDAGPPDGPILARLRTAGVRSIDVLVVTHAQADHEGGTAAVLSRYPVRRLLDGGV